MPIRLEHLKQGRPLAEITNAALSAPVATTVHRLGKLSILMPHHPWELDFCMAMTLRGVRSPVAAGVVYR